jgi:AcrR family transcriptional regulator
MTENAKGVRPKRHSRGAGLTGKIPDKKLAILRSAEELFANHGFHGTSIRDIAVAAKVPPALVHYHFNTKDQLYHEIFRYRSKALGDIREQRLRALFRESGKPRLREVLDAMIRPLIELQKEPGGVAYARLIAREVSDPSEASRGIIAKTLDPIALRFLKHLVDAVPDLPEEKVHWAYHFLIASLIWMMANTGRIQRLSRGRCVVTEPETVIRETVDFFASGIESLGAAKRREASTKWRASAKSQPLPTFKRGAR